MINAVIVDDEPNAIRNLKWEMERFCPELKILDAFSDPVEAISAINYLKPDCVFLDIEMPQMDGFQLLEQLNYRQFDLIITTAYDNYAIRAFKERAIDYLLKPIDSDDLIRSVKRVTERKNSNSLGFEINQVLQSMSPPTTRKISLPMAGKSIFVDIDNIILCKSDGNYTEFFFEDGKEEVIIRQLKEIETLLENKNFVRVHNSYLVNTNHIKEYVRTDGPYLVMSNDATVPISRSKKNFIEDYLNV